MADRPNLSGLGACGAKIGVYSNRTPHDELTAQLAMLKKMRRSLDDHIARVEQSGCAAAVPRTEASTGVAPPGKGRARLQKVARSVRYGLAGAAGVGAGVGNTVLILSTILLLYYLSLFTSYCIEKRLQGEKSESVPFKKMYEALRSLYEKVQRVDPRLPPAPEPPAWQPLLDISSSEDDEPPAAVELLESSSRPSSPEQQEDMLPRMFRS